VRRSRGDFRQSPAHTHRLRKAKQEAQAARVVEEERQRADRQREARLSILQDIPLSRESEEFVAKRNKQNEGGVSLTYGKQ
jgi:hypothetical protein